MFRRSAARSSSAAKSAVAASRAALLLKRTLTPLAGHALAGPAAPAQARGLLTSARIVAPRAHTGIAQVVLAAPSTGGTRSMATAPELSPADVYLKKMRNIGISAHIDSGKTTLTERILFYGGRISAIHDVRGRDGVGAKMDSMDLEREKGITIQSAATQIHWKDQNTINVIDTPGHVDFTIEVERSLRVLDGAVLVICAVGGVQSQSITVDRQMKRYNVPRVVFINKLDRSGATVTKPLRDIRGLLKLNAALVQVPIGSESNFQGVVDVISRKGYLFEGPNGESIKTIDCPPECKDYMEDRRKALIEALAECDEAIGEKFLMEEEPTEDEIRAAIRRATIATKFVPVFMGSAYKNKGVQKLLDGVIDYLPNPTEVVNMGIDNANEEKQVVLASTSEKPLIALAFKLEESRFGQLTYMRVYQGVLRKGDTIMNVTTGKKVKVPRVVRMHSNEMQDVNEGKAGDIIAMFGIDCHSGTTFTDGSQITLSPMRVPEPVISLAVKPKVHKDAPKFGKALARFVKEDPTFKVHADPESGETIISGMGELHLEIYCERIKREYDCEVVVGYPQVNYRETIGMKSDFNYLHKKQSGGAGQYGRVIGYIEPLNDDTGNKQYEFVNALTGNNIPPEFVNPISKGFDEAVGKGPNTGCKIENVRVVLVDGQSHPVDSNEIAFRLAAIGGFRQAFEKANPQILEPYMTVQIEIPEEFQGNIVGELTRRKGMINNVESRGDGYCTIDAEVPLAKMFGYSTDLRSMTQGKGEFTMTYARHAPLLADEAAAVASKYRASLKDKGDEFA